MGSQGVMGGFLPWGSGPGVGGANRGMEWVGLARSQEWVGFRALEWVGPTGIESQLQRVGSE